MAAKAFIELFAGAGMARLGFGAGWRCLLANDNDPGKAGSYRANFGAEGFVLADVAALDPRRVREAPDVVWMSPPCQDVSLAGARAGLDGARSGAFWDAVGFVERLSGTGHAPGAIVLENVAGLLTSNGGRDMDAVTAALRGLGFSHIAVQTLDAAPFLPQSRKRVFVIAARAPVLLPTLPARRAVELEDILDPSGPWRTDALALSPATREQVADGFTGYACANHRRRGSASYWEARFDGLAQCLRTGGGGGSIQRVLKVERRRILHRKMTAREGARLMGLPDSYRLPAANGAAWDLIGDGVAVPVVAHVIQGIAQWNEAPAWEPA